MSTDKIRDENLKQDIYREATTILVGEEILRMKKYSDQKREMKQTKCAYSPLGKALEKQTKTIED